jgi:hypothetical protein
MAVYICAALLIKAQQVEAGSELALNIAIEIDRVRHLRVRLDGSHLSAPADIRRQDGVRSSLIPNGGTGFVFPVGQFGIFAAFGDGESTFNICSRSKWKDRIDFGFHGVRESSDP